MPAYLDLQNKIWSSGQGMPAAALFLVEEMVDWSSDQNFTKCVVVGSLSFSCVALQLLEKLFGDVVCRSPSFESGETGLDVNPSFLAVIVRKLLNLLNLSFSSVKWGCCLLQGYVKD